MDQGIALYTCEFWKWKSEPPREWMRKLNEIVVHSFTFVYYCYVSSNSYVLSYHWNKLIARNISTFMNIVQDKHFAEKALFLNSLSRSILDRSQWPICTYETKINEIKYIAEIWLTRAFSSCAKATRSFSLRIDSFSSSSDTSDEGCE